MINIQAVSDIACPWCYIGMKRLDRAIQVWQGTAPKVTWLPFQLNPHIPPEGQNRRNYSLTKFGVAERPEAEQRIIEAGKEEGIYFDFGENWLAVDTLPLHSLLYVAGREGFKKELKERFFAAYFEQTVHLNNPENLLSLLKEFGWDEEKTLQVLADTQVATAVKHQLLENQKKHISSVPSFTINDIYTISGAQSPDAFLEVFALVSEQ